MLKIRAQQDYSRNPIRQFPGAQLTMKMNDLTNTSNGLNMPTNVFMPARGEAQ